MPEPLLWFIASLIVRAWCYIVRPSSFECPISSYINGVRPSGESECVSTSDSRPEDTRGECHHAAVDQPAIGVRIWCRDGEQAVVVNERTITCRKGA